MSSPSDLPPHLAPSPAQPKGVWIGLAIMALWVVAMGFTLARPIDWQSPWPYLAFLMLTHLYTGLFITAHDAMHRLVSPDSKTNRLVGAVCALLFAFNWYPRLLANHLRHHSHPATGPDPDWHPGGFWAWYWSFVQHYVTVWQILAMAIAFNVAKVWLPVENLFFFWMAPAVLSTFQLFYFGTYLPHKGEHAEADPHKANSQPLGHVWAFLSCYFFGYHHEHHAMPWLPWYRLPAARAYTAQASSQPKAAL